MKEYIEREAAENIFWEEQQKLLKWKRYYQFEKDEKEEYDRLESYQDKIKAIPTADVAEVRHGDWIGVADYGNGNCIGHCSVCGTPHKAEHPTALKMFHKYCSWCGAKMDGKEDE